MSTKPAITKNEYEFGFHEKENYVFKSGRGLSESTVREISAMKNEPAWMLTFRLHALKLFQQKPLPRWGGDLDQIDFDNIHYFIRPSEKQGKTWDDVPAEVKSTFDRLGIPEAEKKFLAGVGAQYESEVVYHNLKESLKKLGVIFLDMDSALREHPEIVKEHFGTIIPPGDNKFAALNSAVWSGGSFVYVPAGVSVDLPLQAYFRINAENMGQFERTLIIAEEGANVHYVEGCLPAGELVSTGHRFVNIESVQPADHVIAQNGERRRVQRVMTRRYRGAMYTIIPQSKGNAVQLTAEHPVLCVRRSSVLARRKNRKDVWLPEVDTGQLMRAMPEFVRTDALKAGDFLVYVAPTTSKNDPTLSPTLLTILGLYLAEGSVTYNRALRLDMLQFSFGKTPSEHQLAQKLVSRIRELGEKAYLITTGKGYYSVTSYSKKLILLCLGHCGKGARTKVLSEAIMQLPPEKQNMLLNSYLEGDGNTYVKRPYLSTMMRASSASSILVFQLQEILARLGIFAHISIRQGGEDTILGRKMRRGDQSILEFTRDKKFSQVRRKGNTYLVPIRAIQSRTYDGPVFNLDVRHPNSYLVKGFAVHNCTAPIYATDSLHSAVVEIIVRPRAKVRYTTIQNWSKNVYNLVTKRAVAYEEASMEWVDGNIGCITTDTEIFLNNAVKRVRDVQPGDMVYSLDSTMQLVRNRVLAKRYSGKKQVFRLRTENYREIKATANHPFLTLAKVGKQLTLTWKHLDEIRLGDHVALSGAIPDNGKEKVFDATVLKGRTKIRLPEKSSSKLLWMLGFYLGDGYLDGSRVCFAVPASDPAHPRLLKALADTLGIHDAKQYGVVVRVNSVDVKNWILREGFGGSARTKRVPSWVFCLPKEQRIAFIEGYIAADGHIRKGHKNISITSVNRKLLQDVKTLAISCGLDPRKISKWIRREKKPLGKEEKVYKHFFLYFGEKNYTAPIHFRPVTAIEPLGKQPTWDLEIGNSHNFVANGFIVHNSKLTMKYPSIYLMGRKARGEILSLAFAGDGQHQDAGGKVIHVAPDTTSIITSKSVSQGTGRTSYRGLVQVLPGATNVKVKVRCDALLLDEPSRSDTYPTMDIQEQDATVEHEAVVSKIGEDQLFYLQSRGLSEAEASAMIVNGFIEPIVKELPMEYAVELNRLVQLEMEGSVG